MDKKKGCREGLKYKQYTKRKGTTMGGNSRQRQNQQRPNQQGDFLDRIFEWTEKAFCPHRITKDTPEPKEDLLDYVFEHVESFTCQEEKEAEPKILLVDHQRQQQGCSFERDNSLLERGPNGMPRQIPAQRSKNGKPTAGHEADMLDYVFEHVESFVCAEDGPDGATQKMHFEEQKEDVRYKAAKQRLQNLYEPEDEIQLYYKPHRRAQF